MTDVEMLAEWIDDVAKDVRNELEDLPPEAIDWQPDPGANSIGVTVFHFSRWFDLISVRTLDDRPQEEEQWFTRGWAEKTGYDPSGVGLRGYGAVTGYTLEEVAAIPTMSAADHLAYLDQTTQALSARLRNLPDGALHQPTPGLGGKSTVYGWIKSILKGSLGHIGEIEALKAMRERTS